MIGVLLYLAARIEGPVAWWRFDEGRGIVAHDAVGHHDGRISGAKWASGRFGGALRFDGEGVVEVPDSPDLRLEGPISVEAWIKPDEISSWHMIVRKEGEYQLRINPPREGSFSAFFVFLDGGWEPRVNGPVPEPKRWHHIVGVWTGEKLQIWLDGELCSRIRRGRPRPTDNPVRIGEGFKGLIDEVRIYRRALRWDEIVEHFTGRLVPAGRPRRPAFDFARDEEGWFAVKGISGLRVEDGVLTMRTTSPLPLISSPPLRGRAEDFDFAAVRMRVDKGLRGELWVTTERGTDSVPFDLIPDGRWHTYNIEVVASPVWEGRVYRIALRPSDAEGARVEVDRILLSPEPAGPPDIAVFRFDLRDVAPRARRPCKLVAVLRNLGGTAKNVKLTLRLPEGVKLTKGEVETSLPTLEFGGDEILFWEVVAERALEGVARLEISAEGAEKVTAEARLTFLPPLRLPKARYVPEPKPVRGPFEIGITYFPGWPSSSRWAPIMPFVERTPALGWYREGLPEVMDWQIKWAVEHGVTFFLFDWYWVRGYRFLEHALHALFKARYGNLIKFAIHWANHNPPGTSSEEDTLRLVRFWIEHYFRRPNYLRIEGKPAVFIFAPQNLTRDLGGPDRVREVWEEARKLCEEAGLGGLYLVARAQGGDEELSRLMREGYNAVWCSSNLRAGVPPNVKVAEMETVWRAHEAIWRKVLDRGIPLIPMLWTGWDSRPWHGTRAYVLRGFGPEGFKRHLIEARKVLEASKGPKVAVVWAWNEWGEGSFCEPCRAFGFGYLDAIREVFTDAPREHLDIVPADVGLGPYEFSVPPLYKTSWDFEKGPEGWDGGMGIRNLRAEEGVLKFETATNDPAVFGPPIRVLARKFPFVEIRMRTTADDVAQLYWKTTTIPESEATVLRFKVVGDWKFRTYKLPVHTVRTWRGIVTRLRLDPANRPGVKVEVDWIRLVGGDRGK